MKIDYLFLALSFLAMSACNVTKEPVPVGNTIYQGFDNGTANDKELPVDSFDIVPLETNPSVLLSYIKNVEVNDSIIFVQDAKKHLYGFNRQGKFRCQYGNRGNAPGEYLAVSSFYIDNSKAEVNIIDEMSNNIHTYDMSGNFLRSNKFPVETFAWIQSAYLIDDTHLLCSQYIFNNENAVYSIIDLTRKKKIDLYRVAMKTDNVAQPIGVHPVSNTPEGIKCILPFSNKICSLTNDLQMDSTIYVQTELPMVPEEELKKIEDYNNLSSSLDFMTKGYFTGFTSIFETSRYVVLTILQNNSYFIVDKNTLQGQQYKKQQEIKELPLIDIYTAYKDMLIGIEDMDKLTWLLQSVSKETTDKNLLRLKEVVSNLPDDSNDCVLFYKLK